MTAPAQPRPPRVRARTINLRRISRRELALGRQSYPEPVERPATRAECELGPRPCPFVGCRFNLYLDVDPIRGSIKLNFPHLEPNEMLESCALDVAERGGTTLEAVAILMNLTRERVRQVEARGLRRMHRQLELGLEDLG